MKLVCYTEWDQLPESANALFEQGAKDNLFYSREWFENVASTLDDDQALVLACVVAGDNVLTILPLIKNAGNSWTSLKHRYTTHYSLLLAGPEHDQEQVLSCLVEGLSRLPIKGLLLEPVANDEQKTNNFKRLMESAGFRCEYIFRHYNWIYRVQGQSYQDYLAARPARLRNTISRKKRKLEREHGYEIRLFTADEVPQAMPDYYAAYTASWKANEQFKSFLDSVVAGFSRAGWSRLAVLYIKGQPAAAQLWFVLHGKASIFRLAYDEAWRQYSPGSILTSFLMEYVIDTDKVEEIDFLTGNEGYKQDWMSDRRVRYALSCITEVKPAGIIERFTLSLKQLFKK